MGSTTATNIQLSWTNSGLVMDIYMVTWKRDTSRKCSHIHTDTATITDGSTSYTIAGLEEDSTYIITVTASNAAGSAITIPVTGITMKAGKGLGEVKCPELP